MGEFSHEYPVNPKAIKLARDSRGMNITQAAKKLGIPPWYYRDIEKGNKEVDTDLLNKLCTVFNYPESFFCQDVVIVYPAVSLHRGMK